MPKCFFTGIEVQLETAYLLDRGAAQRAARNLRQRLAAVDRLLVQLGPKDPVEMADRKTGAMKISTLKLNRSHLSVCRTGCARIRRGAVESGCP